MSPASWDCDGQGNCSDPGTGNGQYSTQSLCQSSCIVPSWDCVGSVCVDTGNGIGMYTDSLLCQLNCVSTDLLNIEYINKGKPIKIIDILGRENKGTKNEPLFYIYDDGTVEKKIILQ